METDTSIFSTTIQMVLLIAALLMAIGISIYSCRVLLGSKIGILIPRPLLCTIVWTLPSLIVWIAHLPFLDQHRLKDALEYLMFVPGIAVLGLIFGMSFWLLERYRVVSGIWWQRGLLGGALGLILTLLAAWAINDIFGPGSGSRGPPTFGEAALWVIWLIPLFAAIGMATPRSALVFQNPVDPAGN